MKALKRNGDIPKNKRIIICAGKVIEKYLKVPY
jgi:hypothetical protein